MIGKRSLSWKMIAAMVSLVLLTCLLTVMVVNWVVDDLFDSYVMRSRALQAERLTRLLENFYRLQGSWENAQALLTGGHGRGVHAVRWRELWEGFVLTDSQGRVVLDATGNYEEGSRLSSEKLSGPVSVEVDEESVGHLYFQGSPGPASLEAQFSRSVMRSVLLIGSVVAVIASGVASYLSRRLTSSLTSLTEGVRSVVRDESPQKVDVPTQDEVGELAQAFNEMLDRLEENRRLRHNLIADISHELRTPLSIIRGNLEAMTEGVVEPSSRELHSLQSEVSQMSSLVSDLHDLSLADAGELSLDRRFVSLSGLISDLLVLFEPLAANKGIALRSRISDSLPRVWADPNRLGQVLRNLVANALQHCHEGDEVEIWAQKLRRAKEGEAPLSLRDVEKMEEGTVVAVIDNGPGIEEEDLPYVFERFYKADKSRTRSRREGEPGVPGVRGTGLGLAIAKSFVQAHGGIIGVESEQGQGSSFYFLLPKKGGFDDAENFTPDDRGV